MSALRETISWCESQKETKSKELIMEVSVNTLDTCVVLTCLGWAEIPSELKIKAHI